MWVLFADGEIAGTAAIATAVCTALGGIVATVMKYREWGRLAELKVIADAKQQEIERRRQEAENRKQEMAEIKANFNSVYKRWQEIAEIFKCEKDKLQEAYTSKCVENVSLQVRLQEALKTKEGSHDP